MNVTQRLEKIAELADSIQEHIADGKLDANSILHGANAISMLARQSESFIQNNIREIESRLQDLK